MQTQEGTTNLKDPLVFTESAAKKVKTLIEEENNPKLSLRVFITGGGCSGFQYGFTFDEKVQDGDSEIENGCETPSGSNEHSVSERQRLIIKKA